MNDNSKKNNKLDQLIQEIVTDTEILYQLETKIIDSQSTELPKNNA